MRRDILLPALLATTVLLGPVSAAASPPSADEIMRKCEEARRVQDATSEATITTTGTSGSDPKVKTFTWWRKLADATHYKTLTRFHTPAEVRGEGILIEERDKGDNDVRLYLPTFKKIRRVEGQSQSASFMGSVFSYADVSQPHVDDYQHTMLRTELCPGEATLMCHVVQSSPATPGTRERTGYSKMVQWIRSDNFVPVRADHFDGQGALWKRLVAKDIREVDTTNHKWLAHEVRMDDLKSGKATVLLFSKVHVNAGIADATFSDQNLAHE